VCLLKRGDRARRVADTPRLGRQRPLHRAEALEGAIEEESAIKGLDRWGKSPLEPEEAPRSLVELRERRSPLRLLEAASRRRRPALSARARRRTRRVEASSTACKKPSPSWSASTC
jgi:hypothetical protein